MTEKEAKKELYSYLHSIKLEQRKLEQIEKIKAKLTKNKTTITFFKPITYYNKGEFYNFYSN